MLDWVVVSSVSEFLPGEVKIVDVDDVMVAVFNLDGEYLAFEDSCPHDGSDIATGCIKDGILKCAHHGATFDLRSGDVLTPPAYEPLEKMAVRVKDGMIEVRDNRWD